MLESPDQRLLIADEVGTGKTIEAGLIWAELESRAVHGLENVWVVCPKSLVGKWQDEMLQRFDFRLESLSAEGLRQALVLLERDGVLPPRFAKSIVNLELIRAEEYMARLGQTAIAWDFVIFDEAHHLRNTDTLSHALAALVCERSKAALFLTATPLQTPPIGHRSPYGGFGSGRGGRSPLARRADALGHGIERLDPLGQASAAGLAARDGRRSGEAGCGWTGTGQAGTDSGVLVAKSDMDDRGQRTVVVDAARDLQVLSPYMTRTLRSDMDEDRPTREAITRDCGIQPRREVVLREGL